MKNVFLKFLSTYILVLLLPILLSGTIYEIALKKSEEYIQATQLSLLQQTKEIIDRYSTDIEWRVFHIANNSKLKNLIYEGSRSIEERGFILREIVNELHSYVIYTSNFNTTFYIYLKDSNLIISPNSVFKLTDFLRGDGFLKIEGMSVEQWHTGTMSKYYPGVFLDMQKMLMENVSSFEMAHLIPYIQSLPVRYRVAPENIQGVILFFIREDEFISLLDNINIPEGGWAYILNQEGKIITGNYKNIKDVQPIKFDSSEQEGVKRITLNGTKMFVIYTTSSKNNWKYVAVLPSDFVLNNLKLIRILSQLAIAIAAVIGIVLSILIAYRRSKPIKEMIKLLSDSHIANPKSDLSRMDVLSGSISKIIDKNRDMQNQLQEQIKFVRSTFFNNLLNGYFRTNQELKLFLSYAGIKILEKKFIVLILNLTGYDSLVSMDIIEEQQKVKVVIKNTLERIFEECIYFSELDDRRIVGILTINAESEEEARGWLQEKLPQFHTQFALYYQAIPQIGVGNICSNLIEINNSFEQAKEALNFVLKHEQNPIAWFTEIHKQTQEYYFPLELEMRLLNSTKAGDTEQVVSILQTVYNENIEERNLLPEKLRELFYEMHGTLIKIKNQVDLENLDLKIDISASSAQVFESLQNLYYTISKNINHKKKSHNKVLIKRIISYLEKKYNDPNLCLYSVASHFSINESYLSYFYKEQTGTNFSINLEKLRMDQATILLKDTNLAIKEIANQVGYNSDKTFRRVFKRVKGISPSKFRQDLLRNKEEIGAK